MKKNKTTILVVQGLPKKASLVSFIVRNVD